ncbi:histidine kinase dimerization/phospho-acceptor domain-containing protein [Acidovorax sp. SRB_24]|uniref:histidine kinase dimerization/phospho-acceptor domain-containing protein n=1 Tax=Acidovorax sp. SRB_24 TaxID=1962700 RepID=UPI00145FAC49|nr:histidine kinase dimerization/phospho-acceptor domain-containing protein [Acidovorax sp. SRB_24]NMM77220.1 two-component sensor histidine kinase [Acidovorax sp. SRB_24]
MLAWSLGALVLVWACFVALAYQTGVEEADELTDGQLASVSALVLNLQVQAMSEPTPATPLSTLPGLKSHDYQQSLSVVLWDAQGRVLVRTGAAPLPPFNTAPGYAEQRLGANAKLWRSFAQWDSARSRKIVVLLDLQERDALAHDIAGQMIEPGLWLLPVVALALGLAIRRGLRPLYELSQEVAQLDVRGDQGMVQRHPLQEFDSIVDSINNLLARQQAALAREREFANEVAHELRTPMASIALQAQALGAGLPRAEQAHALERLHADALRAGHVLTQLLALARIARNRWQEAAAPVDLAQLVRSVAADCAPAAWDHGSELSVSAPAELFLPGHAVLLEMALRNLIENALRHTPRGTCVEVQCGLGGPADDFAAWLQVCDDGAGRQKAQPTRPLADSLHLGHEIVARVAAVHSATFAQTAAQAPFTTCYRLDFASTAKWQAR